MLQVHLGNISTTIMGVKVFDLQLLVGRENIMGDKPRICIESVETCGKNIYVGTNDCFIHHFTLQVAASENSEKQTASVKQQGRKHIGMKKPVIQIKAATALNQLLINCDSTLVVLSMLDLGISTSVSGKIKHINKFCVNERPPNRNPFSIEICVSFVKRKTFQIFQVHKDHVIPMQEISLSEMPRNFLIDGKYVCTATSSAYSMINCESSNKQELFSLGDGGKHLNMICRVGPSEFLITAGNALGVFVSSDGTSNRPPLQWSEQVFACQVSHPYVIALDDEFLTIHSLLDQQQKQSMNFQGGVMMSQCDSGMVLVCTLKDIFLMVPVPLILQLTALIADGLVDEAMTLIKASRRKISPEKYPIMLNQVYCMSGFIRFKESRFDDALSLFNEGSLDPRELISLFPSILPDTSPFKRVIPPLHDIANIRQMCNNDRAQILECQEFLGVYLEIVCNELHCYRLGGEDIPSYAFGMDSPAFERLMSDVFYSTLILFAQLGKKEELQHFIETKSNSALNKNILDLISLDDASDLLNGLRKCGCYHICALIHLKNGDVENAMEVWRSIVFKKVSDTTFPGLLYVAENLAEFCQTVQQLWQNAEWIIQQDQSAGVKIFTSQKNSFKETLQPDDVVNFLHQYPDAVMDYLYHLVVVEKSQKEKFHTHLAVLSLEKVLLLKSEENGDASKLITARRQLQSILEQSDLYRIHILLGKVKDAKLFQEEVILHSKLGEHDKALEILVHNECNPIAAKDYCVTHSKNDPEYQKQLFHSLLSVYFQDISVMKGVSSSTAAAIDLLNNHSDAFQPERVLHILPTHWSISLLTKFLNNSIRHPLHNSRNKIIEYMLLRSQVLQLQRERMALHASPVIIHDGKMCQVCNKLLSEGTFVRYPNGIVVHTQCSKDKHICPVTGKVFKVKKVSDKS